ncbi:YbhB/YbcL family Raf kinase inhibitor-like protein [Edaphobacter albus]|uniref:YbhB/YbcL family Raf kinase inhibitor-like protein n=1 Tax=Edaphobacter sp. 4G125 TaxID=2763071 RepID=UPI00164740DC|nr:YbhB/YbcL family Raf kinase inhibitor-like protein [Edaphobacter sp. 4G125]QNI35544.1 YbhB/YbcL family Raf kinase inhibitor-like protein [Edaphobacter sp. 4G125]
MQLTSNSFKDGELIPGEFCFAIESAENHIALSANRNPHLAWSAAPAGTESFALIVHDPDVSSKGDDVNKEGREVSSDLLRVNFYHWLLIDIPASVGEIAAGSQSNGVTPHGKRGPAAPGGMRHGINHYTQWFASDPQMEGDYFGYDGPCPPWNDSIMHHYVFTLYALDTKALEVDGELTSENILAAIQGHVLSKASLTGKYSLNPRINRN